MTLMSEGAGWPVAIADYENLGVAVTGIGDINGDGVSDLAVGAHGPTGTTTAAGRVYIALLDKDGSAKSAPVAGSDIPLVSYDYFGSSIACPADLDGDMKPDGDLDGDGIVDIAVGAYGDDGEAGQDTGAVYLMFLNSDGTSRSDYIKLSNQTSTDTRVSLSLPPEGEFGRSVAILARNSDDRVTMAVGAPGANNGAGLVYVITVQIRLETSLPVRLIRSLRVQPPVSTPGERFGSAVAWMRDEDGDLYPDLAVGAPGGSASGTVYKVNSRLGTLLHTYKSASESAGDLFGSSVALGFDWDSNGEQELLVGAPGEAGGGGVHLLFMPAATDVHYTPANLGLGAAAGRRLADSDVPIGKSVTMTGPINDDDLVPDLTFGSPEYGATSKGGSLNVFLQAASAPPNPPGGPPKAPLSVDSGLTRYYPPSAPNLYQTFEDAPVGGIIVGVIIGVLLFLLVFCWLFCYGCQLPSLTKKPKMRPQAKGALRRVRKKKASNVPAEESTPYTSVNDPANSAPVAPSGSLLNTLENISGVDLDNDGDVGEAGHGSGQQSSLLNMAENLLGVDIDGDGDVGLTPEEAAQAKAEREAQEAEEARRREQSAAAAWLNDSDALEEPSSPFVANPLHRI